MADNASTENKLLRVRGLTISFPYEEEEHREVVKGIHFSLTPSEILGIAGESGSGKSMTALSVMGLLPEGAVCQVDYMEFEGESLNQTRGKRRTLRDELLGKELAMIFQEPLTSLNPVLTIRQQLLEALLLHETMPLDVAEERMVLALQDAELDNAQEVLACYPHQLSGGMRQRVMIAMAMLHHPKLLIADEPTTALDAVTEREIVALIRNISRKHHTAVLFISHNLQLMRELCDRVIIMKDGLVVERGYTEELFLHPQKAYTKELLLAALDKKRKRDVGEAAHTEQERRRTEPILRVRDVSVTYKDQERVFARAKKKQVVNEVSFDVYEGEIFGLIGESGCGKSTLLKVIAGLHRDYTGGVELAAAEEPCDMKRRRMRGVQMVFQDPYTSLNPAKRVETILEEPLWLLHTFTKEERRARVLEMLAQTELSEEIGERYVWELSGGQRQRVAIAAALIARPRLVLLDEPVSALDVTVQAAILKLLLRLQKEYELTYLFVSHDMDVVKRICDRILVMKDGKMVEVGETEQLLLQPKEEYTRKLIGF